MPQNMFIDACKDISRMPPRCCNQIPIHHIRPYLSVDEISLFKSKYEEWGTPNPFYCPVARCSTFIPNYLLPQARTNSKGKQRVDSGIGTPTKPTVACPKCEVDICTNCRSLTHDGVCGIFDFGVDKETADLIQKWGYRKCPKCGQGVKRMYGCNHMECRCGAHFCWGCMQGKDNCIGECDDDEEEDYSEYEPDEEEDEEFEKETAPMVPAPPASNLAHVFPHMSQIEEPTEPSAPTTSQPPDDTATDPTVSTPRVRNLDGGSGRYWEEQDFDFGEEPTDDFQDRSWDCYHDFGTAKIEFKAAFRNDASVNQMECMKCWATVHPEVKMPANVRAGENKITTAVATASRGIRIPSRRRTGHAQHARRRATGSLRGTRSMETFEATASPLSSSPASFSSLMLYRGSIPGESQESLEGSSSARVVDLYGNTIATANKAKDGNADEHMPDWNQVDEGKSGLSFATDSTPFSFAYECYDCGLLVCHRCKDTLEGHHVGVDVEGDKTEDEHKGDEDTCNVADNGE
ncbi:uncharacterized protein N0V89_001395 [Didymosphaeria variabile]|uniref:RBR-type E3 ubiquitin transferase n=1 Tax=Didymosphaeria variabile TaxID=1932322 RepID=A0A9W9CFV1_9PLEO|nr:uncharacterized protein N0V89_001395 [Didymosphaeria variabile]KAJ4360828.1 hypothetical protein N0V89_001395 [Didymosphaeria variabile]